MVEAVMTDFQYRSIMNMALTIVKKSKDKEEAERELENVMKDPKDKDKNPD